MMTKEAARYACLLARVVLASDDADTEAELAEAFELGRLFVEQSIPPDELMNIHHTALLELASSAPGLQLAQVAARINAPLMEMSMAYGLAFRQQTENRFNAMVQARLEQTSRLQSVGTLAAGVAHDFNNIIGCIVGYAELTVDALPADSCENRNLGQILIACARARDLIKHLLAFARQRPLDTAEVDVVAEIREALELVKLSLHSNVRLTLHVALGAPRVLAEPGSLEQLIMNLCLNANDSLVCSGALEVLVIPAGAAPVVPAGHEQSLCILVRDNGNGIMPELLIHIFDPFFTTKEVGKGSGLGLSVVHGIVSQLGGVIEVHSETSGIHTGTEFAIFLPCLSLGMPIEPAQVEILH